MCGCKLGPAVHIFCFRRSGIGAANQARIGRMLASRRMVVGVGSGGFRPPRRRLGRRALRMNNKITRPMRRGLSTRAMHTDFCVRIDVMHVIPTVRDRRIRQRMFRISSGHPCASSAPPARTNTPCQDKQDAFVRPLGHAQPLLVSFMSRLWRFGARSNPARRLGTRSGIGDCHVPRRLYVVHVD